MTARPRLEIEYCTRCRWLLRAAWMAQELLTTFEAELGEVALQPLRKLVAASEDRRATLRA
jgi:selenoprotein W-related protein